MNIDKRRKIFIYILVVFIVLCCILTTLYIKELRNNKHEFQGFLNQFYSSVDNCISKIDNLTENNPQGVALDENINSLENELLKVDTILHDGSSYIDNKIYITRFFLESTYFLHGIKMTGVTEFDMPAMSEDGKLDTNEMKVLETIKKRLMGLRAAMYSEETKQENPNMSLEEFNNKIIDYTNQQADEIYKDAFGD